MSGTNFLADTNALIYLLAGNECMKAYLMDRLSLSVISEIEMLSYQNLSPDETLRVKSLISDCNVVYLDAQIKDRAIAIRKKYGVKIPDAVIAATSLTLDIPLITADKGFSRIRELNLVLIEPM